ncbi:hypothetical protein RSAG8_10446, partial [Rhizoctonia solani AG-8 WAC10335]
MKPGTYRIINLKGGTAITVNHLGTVGWRVEDSKNQQWFVQSSGEGYRFKNVAAGGYLAVVAHEDSGGTVYCGGYPTTWALVPNLEHRGYSIYGIVVGDTDHTLDLTDWGNAADGTKIYSGSRTKHTGSTQHMAWKFQHINDDPGEESPSIAQTREALTLMQRTANAQAIEIKLLREFLLTSRQEVVRLTSQMEKSQFIHESASNPQHSNNVV